MTKKPRFKYYLEGYGDVGPQPIYAMWIEEANDYSDVGQQTLLQKGFPIPLTPTFSTWKSLNGSKNL